MAIQYVQKTLAQVREAIGRLGYRREFLVGTVLASPAPSSTSFALTPAKIYPTGHYKGRIVYANQGTGAGQSSYVADSAVGTGVLTVVPSLLPTFDATTHVEVWPMGLTPEDVNAQINLSIDDVASLVNIYSEVTSPVLDATRQLVTIPATFVKLIDLSYVTSGQTVVVFRYRFNPDVPRQEQGRDFTIHSNIMRLSEAIPSDASEITIRGYRLPAHPTQDSSLVEIRPDFLTYKALSLLEESNIATSVQDPRASGQRLSAAAAQAQIIRQELRTDWVPNTVILDYGAG